jgi:hypothetical protein
MHYQTIILELLMQYPQLHESLRREKLLLATVKRLARELRQRHDEWQQTFSTTDSGNPLVRAEALERAIQDLRDHLGLASDPEELDPETILASLRAATANG